jgi:hypothetical protein
MAVNERGQTVLRMRMVKDMHKCGYDTSENSQRGNIQGQTEAILYPQQLVEYLSRFSYLQAACQLKVAWR